jgi:hypothetical protein
LATVGKKKIKKEVNNNPKVAPASALVGVTQ